MGDDTLLIILGNQLFEKKYLSQAKTKNIFMAEDFGLCTEEKYHKQKIFFFLSAMRCFKDEVSDLGYKVFYNKLSDKNKNKDFIALLDEFLDKNKFKTLKFFEIEDKFFEKKIFDFLKQKEFDFEIIQSPMFLCSRDKFNKFAQNKKNLRMVSFYQLMRKDLNILISDGKPLGGKWSYDEENRKKIPKDLELPKLEMFLKKLSWR
jgi:deoxyribodipyrimidine photolyase-related protein